VLPAVSFPLATFPFPEPDQLPPCTIPLLEVPFQFYRPIYPFSSSLPIKTLYASLLSTIRATCPPHLIPLDFMTPIIFGVRSTDHVTSNYTGLFISP